MPRFPEDGQVDAILRQFQTTRRGFIATSVAAALAGGARVGPVALSVSAAPPLSLQAAPVRGGTLNVLVQNDWVSLDPLFNSAEPNGTTMIYDHWLRWEKDPATGAWGPQPDLIAAWDLQPDHVTLTLQTGVAFHDETPWDAAAAKWNLDRMIFHPASTMKSYLAAVDTAGEDQAALDALAANAAGPFTFASKAVEVVDPATVRIRLKQPLGPILAVLSNALQWNNPVSPTAYNALGKDGFSRAPVGSGPYRFVEWQSGNQVVVERNQSYWKAGADGQPLPYLDGITYRLVIDDSVRLLELQSGNADFTELIQGKDVPALEADPAVRFMQSEDQGNNYRMIFDSTNPDNVFVKHKALRQAMLYAMDRDAMVQVLGFGAGIPRLHLLPTASFAYDESIPSYGFDRERATQLVQEVIAADPAVAPNGKVPVTLTVIDRAIDKTQSEMIKQMADAVGFEVTIEILERAAWVAKLVRIPGQEGGSFQFATMRNPVAPSDPDLEWRTFYYSSGGFNVAHLSDPTLDGLIEQAAATYDTEARTALYHQLAQIAYDEPWYGFLWQQNWNWAATARLQNFEEPVTNRWMFTETWLNDA